MFMLSKCRRAVPDGGGAIYLATLKDDAAIFNLTRFDLNKLLGRN